MFTLWHCLVNRPNLLSHMAAGLKTGYRQPFNMIYSKGYTMSETINTWTRQYHFVKYSFSIWINTRWSIEMGTQSLKNIHDIRNSQSRQMKSNIRPSILLKKYNSGLPRSLSQRYHSKRDRLIRNCCLQICIWTEELPTPSVVSYVAPELAVLQAMRYEGQTENRYCPRW
jgi:hypothetical protein